MSDPERDDERLLSEVEAALRDALSNEPSPDLSRRVRERIEARAARTRPARFALPALLAAALGLGAFLLWMRPEVAGPPGERALPQTGATPLAAPGPSLQVPTRAQVPGPVAGRSAPPRPTHARNQVVVPAGTAHALLQLAALARDPDVDPPDLLLKAGGVPPPLEAEPLEIRPLSVPPLEPEAPSPPLQRSDT